MPAGAGTWHDPSRRPSSRRSGARERGPPLSSTVRSAEVLAHRPQLVGFTSVFQQHVASLALARRIKAAAPATVVVLGGANCEGVMGAETVRSFAFVDAAVSGEGDLVFPELARRVLEGRPLEDLPGRRDASERRRALRGREASRTRRS